MLDHANDPLRARPCQRPSRVPDVSRLTRSLSQSSRTLRSMQHLPTVKLDSTLAELYTRTCPKHSTQRIGQVLCGTNSGISLTGNFLRNVKYLYQDSAFNKTPSDELDESNRELRRSLAMKHLSLVPQPDAFIAGKTPVILFDSALTIQQLEEDRRDMQTTLSVLEETQRPELIFCPGPEQIPMEQHSIDVIACKAVLDGLERYPTTCDLDTLWFLNSKVALARSGLSTPGCHVIDLDGACPDAEACCDTCRSGDPLLIPEDCSKKRGRWLTRSIDQIVSAVQARKLPFVVKTQQTFGGAGTWIITTDEHRQAVVKDLSGNVLRKLFSQVTQQNYHLKPGSVILSNMIHDPIGDYGLTFFVGEDGVPVFLAASEQVTDSDHAWTGSTIDYGRQSVFRERFTPTMNEIAAWVHKYKYYGPVGADILETRSVDRRPPSRENYQIVDLNVRTSGSLCLPFLRNHLTSRGIDCASSFGISAKATRNEFIEQWKDLCASGQMCILSWCEDKEQGISLADVVIGGEDQEKLQEMIKRVQESTEDITF